MFLTNYPCLVERKHNEIILRERELLKNTNWPVLQKVCCKSMFQAEYGLKRPHSKYNTYQYYVSLIFSPPHYIKESVYQYVFHFVHELLPKTLLH